MHVLFAREALVLPLIAGLLVFVGCDGLPQKKADLPPSNPAPSPTASVSSATLDEVRAAAASLLGKDISELKAGTTLGDLGADELDFVELVMELEDRFDVSLADDSLERMMGSDDWQRGRNNVTLGKLAALVEESK